MSPRSARVWLAVLALVLLNLAWRCDPARGQEIAGPSEVEPGRLARFAVEWPDLGDDLLVDWIAADPGLELGRAASGELFVVGLRPGLYRLIAIAGPEDRRGQILEHDLAVSGGGPGDGPQPGPDPEPASELAEAGRNYVALWAGLYRLLAAEVEAGRLSRVSEVRAAASAASRASAGDVNRAVAGAAEDYLGPDGDAIEDPAGYAEVLRRLAEAMEVAPGR